MSALSRSGSFHPRDCWAISFVTAQLWTQAGDVRGSWAADVDGPAGTLCWIWILAPDGTEFRNKNFGIGTHTNVVIDGAWGKGEFGEGWFEARGPTGELLGKSARISFTGV
jgi:hypothetical protein